MTDIAVVQTDVKASAEAGAALGSQALAELHGQAPDAMILFASSSYRYDALLQAVHEACRPAVLVGCSSAGEFIGEHPREHAACAIAIRSTDMQFTAGIGRGLRADRAAAAGALVSGFVGQSARGSQYAYRHAMILTDALAGYADELIDQVTRLTAGVYQLFGGGAGDDARFHRTHVFFGTEAVPDAAVALEILSNKPLGIGVSHGWQPATRPMRVTEAEGMRLASLDAMPALEALEEHARATGQQLDRQDPMPFFLHNVLGIRGEEGYKLRVPLGIGEDGSIICAADIPNGSTVCIMRTTASSAAEAAAQAAHAALEQLKGLPPKAAIFFDCVATRLRIGGHFGLELAALREGLGTAQFAGCNTYGQIARAHGQFSGFHNCTAVIGVFPD
ncbi:MAG TPA: FIST N-terminal domain-containing protein [Steroidobacteraceae bacterium]|nr:FIST N-terminal domain-containing protein [Steroidobacteraceae bacterium]